GPPAGPNPWNGWTLEWALPSPPPAHDFDTIPTFSDDGTIHFKGTVGLPNGSSPGIGIGEPNGSSVGNGSSSWGSP
ncbi:hypothetical protein E6H26_06405, partial [Candidatus Bathyarchaeota archaeon]